MTDAKDPDEFIKKFGSTRFKLLLESSGDAISFELEKCKNGLDLSVETDRYTFLRKIVNVISSLEDPLLRDVYISKISRESETNIDVLRAQIDDRIKNKNNIKKKKEWKSIEQKLNARDDINPDAAKYVAQSRAEEFIILYLIKNPDKLDDILSKISADEFVTDFNKKVFTAVSEVISSSSDFSLSMLSENFSVAEMGKISGIEAKNREITITDVGLHDCIQVLKDFKTNLVYTKKTDMSDDDLRAFQLQMQNKK